MADFMEVYAAHTGFPLPTQQELEAMGLHLELLKPSRAERKSPEAPGEVLLGMPVGTATGMTEGQCARGAASNNNDVLFWFRSMKISAATFLSTNVVDARNLVRWATTYRRASLAMAPDLPQLT